MPSFQHQRVFVVDLRLPQRHCQLEDVEQTTVQLNKDWSHVVCNKPAQAHSTCVSTVRRHYDWPGDLSSWPWHLHRRRPEHKKSRSTNRVIVIFAVLRQLQQIRGHIPPATFQTLVIALVLSWLDYGNGILVGLPACLVRRLQSFTLTAAFS